MDVIVMVIFISIALYAGYRLGNRFSTDDENESEMVGQIRGARELSKLILNSNIEKGSKDKALQVVGQFIRESRDEYHDMRK